MIIATAGHVDHGKTLLIRSLTGIDTDRLPEEKKRSLTIDLGFAYLPLDGAETIGFIDVPGHERFIRNMLCGVAGIDFVLFIVAADDGPMPQTEEHLAILDLLGVARGAVALTKIDRVPEERAVEVAEEIEILLAGTSLDGIPVFPVSAMTGAGMDALRAHLIAASRDLPERTVAGNFRLAIDRSFDVVGAGLVVTGTAFSGAVSAGDTVRVSGAAGAAMDVRIRGIHAQNAQSDRGRAGQRCALNLAGTGLDKASIRRGDWVVSGSVPAPARKIDIELRLLGSEARPLAHWTPVHVHLGASETTGRVALLGSTAVAPGETGLAQLVLDDPIGALHGDRLILRDQSARRTIGGGRVIDIFPPARGRARPERLAFLSAMRDADDGTALAALLDTAGSGINLDRFAAARNMAAGDLEALAELVPMRTVASAAGRIAFSERRWTELRDAVLAGLAEWHRKNPDTVGPGENRVLAGTGIRLPADAAAGIAAALVREGVVVKEGMGIRLPDHRPRLEGNDAILWKRIQPLLAGGGPRPPVVVEIAREVDAEPRRVESLLVRAGRHGLVVRVAKNRFYLPSALRELAAIAEKIAGESDSGLVTAADFRDASGTGRNVAIEILEFFDKTKFTRRMGDAHEILRPAAEAFGDG